MQKSRRRGFSPTAKRLGLPIAGTVIVTSAWLGASLAHATTSPHYNVVDSSSRHVTADALPTAQIDSGVVWTTTIAGDTVFAGGEFSNARPAGAAAGTNLVARSNLMAFSLSTGVMTDFAPVVNGPVRSLALSPDHSILYVGGRFTQVNGQARSNVAAFNVATGALLPWAPTVSSTVKGIATQGDVVYLGGLFTNVNGLGRDKLAAVTTDGTLTKWKPSADYDVDTMALTPDGTRLIVGGGFSTMNGVKNPGIAALDPNDGTVYPYAVNQVVQNSGANSAILSVKSDGTDIVATAYNYNAKGNASGNYEGLVRVDADTGKIIWMADCHGDTYDSASVNGDIYAVSHHHDCSNVGSKPQDDPWTYQRADSWTPSATSTVRVNSDSDYHDFHGQPAPSEYDWFPTLTAGTYTGQSQAAWTASGSGDYLVLGGEFPSVNGQVQSGLVRFTTPDKAPNHQGPNTPSTTFVPTLSVVNGTNVKLTWPSTWDRDDQTLHYAIIRSDQTTPLATLSQTTQWWNTPTMSYLDAGLQPNTAYTYKIKAYDDSGNVRYSSTATVTTSASGTSFSRYAAGVINDNPDHYWAMNDAAARTPRMADQGGLKMALTGGTGVTLGAAGMNSEKAAQFSGASSASAATSSSETGPQNFAIETWINTTSTTGGKIVGFGKAGSWLTSANYDRHVYMTNSGQLVFGVNPNKTMRTITSPASYNDGKWHQVVAQVSGAGMQLYVDNTLVASDASTTGAEASTGYWNVGGGPLTGWPNKPTAAAFKGTIDDTSIYYGGALSGAQIKAHWVASGRAAVNAAPTVGLTVSCDSAGVCSAISTANDTDGTIAGYAWSVDGATVAGTGATNSLALKNGNHTVAVTVTDDSGATATASQAVTVVIPNKAPTAAFKATTRALTATLDASASSDSDGTIASYAWDFGDGSTGSGRNATHAYARAGAYTATLTVTDDQGATSTSTQEVNVGNSAPTATFTTATNQLAATFDASASTDSDGTITSYAWDFGDSTTATGATATHTYGVGGTYTVTLTTTDDLGATTTTTKQVTVVDSGPVVKFSDQITNQTATFDASASTDTTGAALTSYAWDFGDGTTGSGVTATHTYAAAGTYTVTLTVTDANGETAQGSDKLTAVSAMVAQDDFAGTRTNWGTPVAGGSYVYSKASLFSAANGAGVIKMSSAGQTSTAFLSGTDAAKVKFTGAFAVDKVPTGSGETVSVIARHTADGEYRMSLRFMADGTLHLSGTRVQGSTATTLKEVVVSGLTYTAGQPVNVEFQLSGTTSVTITGTAWTTTRPATPALNLTDTSVPVTSGQVGFMSYLSGSATNAPVNVTVSPYTIERLA